MKTTVIYSVEQNENSSYILIFKRLEDEMFKQQIAICSTLSIAKETIERDFRTYDKKKYSCKVECKNYDNIVFFAKDISLEELHEANR